MRRALKRVGAFVLAGILVLGVGLPVLAIEAFALYWLLGWTSAAVDLPNGERLVLEQLLTHPLLAEYEYRVRLEQAGRPVLKASLYPNLGGRTFARVWRDPARPLLLLDGTTGLVWINLERRCVSPGAPSLDPDYPTTLTPRCPDHIDRPLATLITLGVFDMRSGRLGFHPRQPPARAADIAWSWRKHEPVPLPLPYARLRVLARQDGPYSREDGLLRVIVERGRETVIDLWTYGGSFDAFSPWGVDLFWYPRGPAGGPFLRLNKEEGWLLDLGSGQVFRCFSKFSDESERRAAPYPVLLDDPINNVDGDQRRLMLYRGDAQRFDGAPPELLLRSTDTTIFLGYFMFEPFGDQGTGFFPSRTGTVKEAYDNPWRH